MYSCTVKYKKVSKMYIFPLIFQSNKDIHEKDLYSLQYHCDRKIMFGKTGWTQLWTITCEM